MEIKNGFTSVYGVYYPNIREVAFTKSNIMGNMGKCVNETKREENDFFKPGSFEIDDRGVYIFKSKYDEKKALRIYKCFADYHFNGEHDDELTSKLNNLQNKIKLTEFPTGVVTLDGYVIGQEIPYYEEYKTLYESTEKLSKKELFIVYRKCLNILMELKNNGVCYIDCHAKNFLVNDDLDVKLIDFENELVKLDGRGTTNQMNNLYNMINTINELANVSDNKLVYSKDLNYLLNDINDLESKVKCK